MDHTAYAFGEARTPRTAYQPSPPLDQFTTFILCVLCARATTPIPAVARRRHDHGNKSYANHTKYTYIQMQWIRPGRKTKKKTVCLEIFSNGTNI